MITIN
jgi:acyl dehydratase